MKLILPILSLAYAQVRTEFTSTFEAAQAGDTYSLKRLRRSAKEHNAQAVDGWQKSALHYAAEYGHSDVADTLINSKADLMAADYKGRTPAMLAAKKGHIAVLQNLIVKCNKDENCENDQKDENGKNALHYAAENGQVQVIQILCNNINVQERDNGGKTALMLAASRGHGETVLKLISGCKDRGTDLVDEKGMCASMHAAAKGHESIFRILQGRSKPLMTPLDDGNLPTDNLGRNVYHHIVNSGNSNFLQSVLRSANDASINRDNNGESLIHYAARNGNRDALSMILRKWDSSDYLKQVNYDGENALHLTVKLPSVGFAEILEYNQPLSPGHFQCMVFLASKDTPRDNYLYHTDNFGYTPLLRAVEWGDSVAIKYLIKKYAAYDRRTSHGVNADGDSLFHVAIRHNRINALSTLLNAKLNFDDNAHSQYFLNSVYNQENENPLFYAVKDGNYRAVELLLRAGMNTNEVDGYNKTPLIWAVIGQKYDIANLLLHNGADAYGKDKTSGVSALHYAAGSGDNEMVNLIISWMAKDKKYKLSSLQRLDKSKSTPLDTASYLNKGDIVGNLMGRMIKLLPGYEAYREAEGFRGNQFRNACSASDADLKEAALQLFDRPCALAHSGKSVGSLEALKNCCRDYMSETEQEADEEWTEDTADEDADAIGEQIDESSEFFTEDVEDGQVFGEESFF